MNYWKILESMNGLPTDNMWNALWGANGAKPVPTEFFILNVSKLGIGKLK